MKLRSLAILPLAVICLSAAVSARADEPANSAGDRLKVLQEQFDELKMDAFAAQKRFDARYLEELKKLETKAQGEGKLELVVATREEAEEFRTRPPAAEKASPFAELARLQLIYDEKKAQISAERAEVLGPLVAGYQKRLGDLKVELTKAGDIDGALEVQAVASRIAAEFSDDVAEPESPARSKKGVVGQFVRIELSGKEETFLHIAEVEVYSGEENIALKGKATQASTWGEYDGQASAAIDGNTDGTLDGHSLAHTSAGKDLWWELDLGEEKEITRIVIWNRGDGLESRLDGFELSVRDKRHNSEWEKTFETAPREIAVEVSSE